MPLDEEMNRKIGQVLGSFGDKSKALDQRLLNLESAEGSNLNFYGSMYQYNLGTVIAVAAAGTFYTITGMVTGLVKGFTFAASVLTCAKAGKYKIDYSVSFSNMVGNSTVVAVLVNGTVQQPTASRSLTNTAADYQNLSGTGIVTLTVDDDVTLAIKNETDADDPTIDYASISLNRVGD